MIDRITQATRLRAAVRSLVAALLALPIAGCDSLLDVKDPDLVVPEDFDAEQLAELSWAGAIGQFAAAYSSNPGGQIMYVGLFTDEFHLSGTFPTREQVDQREILASNGTMEDRYTELQQARSAAEETVVQLEELFPGDPRIAEMYSLAGYTYTFFGENYCSGVPYSRVVEGEIEYGLPMTTEETFQRALERFVSASEAAAGDEDQAYLAAVGMARVKLNQGAFAEAAAAAAMVPDDWEYLVRSKEGSTDDQRNAIYEFNQSQRRWSLSDEEGGNGVAFRSEPDARLEWEDNGNVGFDESTPLYEQLKYPSFEADVPLASGLEAKLIQAEAALAEDNVAGLLSILNALRATVGLAELSDPGSDAERVDLLFDERARWLFATAHRLSDMRRLVRQYGRAEGDVFPAGPYFKGGEYGDAVNFPIPDQERENPNFDDCLDRSA